MIKTYIKPIIAFLLLFKLTVANAQMITGVWKGRINRQKAELKIIQNGDSLTGTSYYYESENNYRRYSIKGYFDKESNEAVWWDDELIEEKSTKFSLTAPGKNALLSSADFNCPGSGKMMLDGKAALKEDETKPRGEVHLDKTGNPMFQDDWDFVIDNYTTGANDPDVINEIANNTHRQKTVEERVITDPVDRSIAVVTPPVQKPVEKAPSKSPPKGETSSNPIIEEKIVTIKKEPKPVIKTAEPIKPPTIEEKFVTRKKVLIKEIPVTGDSIELRFYDNAEIDGDSISLFLNNKLIFQHIRLLGSAYTIKLAVSDLNESNELIMVAENLGSIPPNTSYMVAVVGDNQYDARLESTEGSSAMIRFVKKKPEEVSLKPNSQ